MDAGSRLSPRFSTRWLNGYDLIPALAFGVVQGFVSQVQQLPAGDYTSGWPGSDTHAGGDVKGQFLVGEFVLLHSLPKTLTQG